MASQLLHTVKPSGGDFTSLDACIDHLVATHPNLVSDDNYADVEISGDWSSTSDTTAVDTYGLTTDSTHYLHIYADSYNRPLVSGWTTSRYQLTVSNAKGIYLQTQYVRVGNLQVEVYDAATSGVCLPFANATISSGGSYFRIYNCRVRLDCNSGITNNVLGLSDSDLASCDIWNSLFYARSDNQGTVDGCYLAGNGSAGDYNVYNCAIFNVRRGIRDVNTTYRLYDTVVFDCTADWYNSNDLIDYCAHDDSARPEETNEVSESGGGAGWPDDYEDVPGGDLTLLATSNLVDAGGQAGSGLFSDDMEGNSRASTWSVGPTELVAAGGTTLSPTTLPPTTIAPTTLPPTTLSPTTLTPTTLAPTTLPPTTLAPTTLVPTTLPPTTLPPTTIAPTTLAPTTLSPTTLPPTTLAPTTLPPTTLAPTTLPPTTLAPTTLAPTTLEPTTLPPTTLSSTTLPPTTLAPTTLEPTTLPPTTLEPTTLPPTTLPPTTLEPTTLAPTTLAPTTLAPTTLAPTTLEPTTLPPTTIVPTTLVPTTIPSFTTSPPATILPTSHVLTTLLSTTLVPTTEVPLTLCEKDFWKELSGGRTKPTTIEECSLSKPWLW